MHGQWGFDVKWKLPERITNTEEKDVNRAERMAKTLVTLATDAAMQKTRCCSHANLIYSTPSYS